MNGLFRYSAILIPVYLFMTSCQPKDPELMASIELNPHCRL